MLDKLEHTLLKPTITAKDIKRAAEEVKIYGFANLCTHSKFISLASEFLPQEKLCTVIAFPLSDVPLKVKLFQVESALEMGAGELDVVVNLSAVKEGNWRLVVEELREIRQVAEGKILKLIIECCYLSEFEKVRLAEITEENGWDFVKTSTGFGKYGARIEDVKLLKGILKKAKVKASGGIRSLKDALEFLKAGADKIGTSSALQIAREFMERG